MAALHLDRSRLLGVALVVFSACGFGSGPLFAKPVYASGVDWLTLLFYRFLFGAALGWLWLLARRERRAALRAVSRRRLVILAALGIFYVGNTATYFAALETVPASLAALIVYIYPPIVAVLAIRFGRRLHGRRPWLGLVLATAGVLLAVGGINPGTSPPPLGLALAIASPLIYAMWIVLAARLGGERPEPRREAREIVPVDAATTGAEETDAAPAAALMMTATFVVYLVAVIATRRPFLPAEIPAAAWPGLLGVGVFSTFIAVLGFYAGARRIGAAQAAIASTVEPIYTIALATLLFAEVLAPLQIVGGVLVIVGVIVAQAAAATGEDMRTAPAQGTT